MIHEKGSAYKKLFNIGLLESYKGFAATLYRDIIFHAAFFGAFSSIKIRLRNYNEDLSPFGLFLANFGACVLSIFLSNPFDVIKSRLQKEKVAYIGLIDCYLQMRSKEGILSLWKGSLSRTLVLVPLLTIGFTLFEMLQRIFAPDSLIPLSTWQHDFDIVRQSRITNVSRTLKEEFGIDLANKNIKS